MSAPVFMKLTRKIRKIPEAVLAFSAMLILPFFSRPMIVVMARGLGRMAFMFSSRLKRIAMANMDVVFGGDIDAVKKKELVIESFQTFSLVLLDLFWFSRNTGSRISRYVIWDESSERLIANRRAIVVSAHLGNWEVAGLTIGAKGHSMISVAAPLKNRFVDGILRKMRTGTAHSTVPREGAIKKLISALRRDERVAMLLDQNVMPEEGGEFVDFFDLKAPVSRAAEALCLSTHAAIVFTYCLPMNDGTYEVRSKEVLSENSSSLTKGDVTARIVRVMQDVIRENPGKWLWMYKRWKYIPDGEDARRYPFYAAGFPCDK